MAGKFHLVDPLKKYKARILFDGTQITTNVPPTPSTLATLQANGDTRIRYLNALLGSNGQEPVANDNSNMNVDGSITPQEFYIEASEEYNFVVTYLIAIIADGSVSHNSFGDVGQLINGWDLYAEQDGEITYLANSVTTGGEALVQSGMFDGWGTASDVNTINGYAGGGGVLWNQDNDAMLIKFPINTVMPQGLVFTKGTTNRLVSVVNDDLTGLTQFSVRVLGYKG